MNEDDLYVEISWNDYLELIDNTGYYKTIDKSNIIKYYKNDQLHRLNGPAYLNEQDKIYVYYQNGKKHRLDDPAFIAKKIIIHNYYYLYDKKYTKEEFNQHPEVIQYRIQKFQEYMK